MRAASLATSLSAPTYLSVVMQIQFFSDVVRLINCYIIKASQFAF